MGYCDQCIELAEAVPQSMLDDCPWGGEMVKTKMFMKCMMKKKIKTCMRYDIKHKLVEETKIPENQLYMIVKQMLKGPEMMMMEMRQTDKMTKITSTSKDLSKFNTDIGQDEDALPKNHITIQNHYGDGFWLWGISP